MLPENPAITEAMLEAGMKELACFDRRFDYEGDIVENIFNAMWTVYYHGHQLDE